MRDHDRTTLWVTLATVAILIAWLLVAGLLIPIVIEHAYSATSPSVLGDLMPRRTTLPLEHYLARGKEISLTVLLILAVGGLGLIAATRPAVQRCLDRRPTPSNTTPAAPGNWAPLSRGRLLVVNAIIAVLIGGHLLSIVTRTERWPFSHYGMFSGLARPQLSARLLLYGVTDAGDMPLRVSEHLQPFDDQRFRGAIQKMMRRPNGEKAVARALRYAGARYERLRAIGAHHGPPLLAVKLVEASWARDEWARNTASPDSLRVLYEIRLGGNEALIR
jgi:hypothetical protein